MNLNNLYPYQREAYEAVMNHFNSGEQRACIVHATGLGKSYVIAAVAEHFQNILIVAPNNYVIAQVQSKVDRDDVDYITYTQLMFDAKSKKIVQGKYNLIVFDEFHRTGAKRWAEGVKYVMKQNAEAKIFGTSATPIRYLDNGRNMAEELFNGHVMDTINVTDAWVRGILIPPVYVISLEDFCQVKEDYLRKINSEYVPGEARPEMLQQLETAQQAWDKSGGVPGVIRDNISPDVKRIIVFCPKIDKIEEDRDTIIQWFREAGIRIYKTYIIDSSRSQKSNENEMACFQQDGYQGVKIMISINMLNEGIHIPRVDAIVMLRRTVSMNIYLQQMGRCMVATDYNRNRPIILDLQNNIINVGQNDFFTNTEKEYEESVRKTNYSGEDRFMIIKGVELNIINAIQTIDVKFKDFYNSFDWNNNYTEAKVFFEKYGHFPKYRENRKRYGWAKNWWRNNYLKNPEMHQDKANMLTAIGFEYKDKDSYVDEVWMEQYDECKAFYQQSGCFPTRKENERLYRWAMQWWRNTYLKSSEKHQEKADMLTAIGFLYRIRDEVWDGKFMKNWEEAKAFYEQYGHFPKGNEIGKINAWAMNWWKNNYLKNPEMHQDKANMLTAIGFEYKDKDSYVDEVWMENYDECKASYQQYGHFPTKKENGRLYAWAMNWYRKTYLKNQELYQEKADMLTAIGLEYRDKNSYVDEVWMENYDECKAFYQQYGHFPTKKENERLVNWAMQWWRKLYLKSPKLYKEKAVMLTAIGFMYKSSDEMWNSKFIKNYKEAKAFFEEHGYFPSYKENIRLYSWVRAWWTRVYLKNPEKHQEKADMLTAIGFEYKGNKQ